MGGGHHLPAHGPGVPLPGSHHGLAQPLRGGLAAIQHPGADFCVETLQEALGRGRPGIFNTDQGSQFTSREFTRVLQNHQVRISMGEKGRYADNIFVERLWRTVKYEEVYLKAYAGAKEARRELGAYFRFYNVQRPHQALGYRTPAEVYHQAMNVQGEAPEEWRCSREPARGSLAGAAGLSLNSTSILSN